MKFYVQYAGSEEEEVTASAYAAASAAYANECLTAAFANERIRLHIVFENEAEFFQFLNDA